MNRLLIACLGLAAGLLRAAEVPTPAWTHADVAYGDHPKQRMDVWLPDGGGTPAPVAMFVHGGGWTKGERWYDHPAQLLEQCRKSRCAFVTVDYRFLADARGQGVRPPVRAPMADVAAAIRFVQRHAAAWNVDPKRIGLTGGSAGACSSLSCAFAKENALGIRAVAAFWPQSSLDPQEMKAWIPNSTYGGEAFGYRDFADWLAHREESLKWIETFSPAALIRKCPAARAPTVLCENAKPLPPGELPKDPTHASAFREKLGELCREKGISFRFLPSSRLFEALVRELTGDAKAPAVAKDPFCDAAAWSEKTSHAKALELAFGCPYRGEPSLVVSNAVGREFDTAWRIVSERRPVGADDRWLSVSFRAAADWAIPAKFATASWCNAVRWYDAAGRQVVRDILPCFVIGRRFSRITWLSERPASAVSYALELGFDTPNVSPGKRLALTALDCRLSRARPADGASDAAELREPEVRFTPPAGASDGFSFVASDASGVDWRTLRVTVDGADVTAALVRKGDKVSFPKPAAPWADGLHKVVIRVADAIENLAESEKFFFFGPRPSDVPDCRLRQDGMTLVNGRPFFPIGVYGVGRREFNAYDLDRACADLKAGGFNLVQSYSDNDNPAFFAAARRHGLMTWCEFRSPEKKEFRSFQRGDASCLARYTGDDTAEYFSPSVMLDRHENARALDPARLTCQADPILDKNSRRSRYREYVKCTDVFMPEIYPVHDDDAKTASNCVATVVRDMDLACRDIADAKDSAPHGLWPIIQYFKGWGWQRFPTREELFAMSFASIVHGANGITFYTYGGWIIPEQKVFNYGITTSAERWGNMTNLASRVAFLAPALLSETGGRCDPKVTAGPSEDPLGQPSVTALWKRTADATWLVAVNAAPAKVRATFALPASAGVAAGEGETLWEGRRVKAASGTFDESFAPFAVHVYRFR